MVPELSGRSAVEVINVIPFSSDLVSCILFPLLMSMASCPSLCIRKYHCYDRSAKYNLLAANRTIMMTTKLNY